MPIEKKISKKNSPTKRNRPGLSKKINLPVISGPDTLPLLDPNFGWDNFERFTKVLVSEVFKNTDVNIMGKKGEKQYGIDLIAKTNNGTFFFAQCKQYKSYSVLNFKKAKSDLELNTDKCILLLACEASAALRLEVLSDDKWEIWDAVDLSDKVFSLNDKDKFKIIKKFFGKEWATAFADYNQFSSLVSPFEYYKHFLDTKKLFNHSIPYLARDSELEYLRDFTKSNHKVLVLNSPGGIGKSRLLWELSKSSLTSDCDFLFIREGMKPEAEHFQNIISQNIIFVFDDAHRYDPLPYLSFIQLLDCKYKIIFSTRPQGRNNLKLNLRKLNIESQELVDLELKNFSKESGKRIVNSLLPNLHDSHLLAMAKLMTESTLIGILACNLLKRKAITLSTLVNDLDFKETIMSKFIEELAGNIESNVKPESVKKLLSLISALAPINYNHGEIQKEFLDVTDLPLHDIKECVADLLYSGLLNQRGGQIRIAPDILSDCILEESCFFKNNLPSNFYNDLIQTTAGSLRINLIKNISELDWRKRSNSLSNTVLLKGLWTDLDISPDESMYLLSNKLTMVQTIAYYQPIESYHFVIKAFEYLSKENRNQDCYNTICRDTLVRTIKDIIVAGYKTKQLMMLLWKLGKKDRRSLNSHPNHPARQLSDLCSYQRNLPIELYEKTFQGLVQIVKSYNPSIDLQNPIEMLSGFLLKSSHSTFLDGNSVSWSPFLISFNNTKELRSDVIKLLVTTALSSKELKKSYSAVNVLINAISPPKSFIGLKVSDEDISIWSKELKCITEDLIKIYNKTCFDLIKLEIRNGFARKRRWINYPSCKKTMTLFLNENPVTSSELQYVPFLFWKYKDIFLKRDLKNYKKMQERDHLTLKSTIKNCTIHFMSTSEFLKFADHSIHLLRKVGENPSSHMYSHEISEFLTLDNKEMCELLLSNNSNRLESDFHIYLFKVSTKDITLGIKLINKALVSQNIVILTSISKNFWYNFENHSKKPILQNLFKKFYNHKNEMVKNASSWSIKVLSKFDMDHAIDCLMNFTVNSTAQAQALTDVIEKNYGIPSTNITNPQLETILDQIKDVDDLTQYDIQQFIDVCSKRIPEKLLETLIYRVKSKRNQNSNFTALPYLGFKNSLNLNINNKQCIIAFDSITNLLRSGDGDRFWLPNLFYELAQSKHDLSIDYLTKLIKSNCIKDVQIGLIFLSKFNHSIVFSNQNLIKDFLGHGKKMGNVFFNEIKGNLFNLAIPSEKNGTSGEPMPQDILLVKNAKIAIEKSEFDYEEQFFLELKKYGEKEIEETKIYNERRYE